MLTHGFDFSRPTDLVIVLAWLVFLFYRLVSYLTHKTTNRGAVWRQSILTRTILALAVILVVRQPSVLFWVKTHPILFSNPTLRIAGTIACILGIALAIWARAILGKNWGMPMTMRTEPELVTSGPYHYVRHPIYSGVILAMIGSALASSPIWIIICGCVTICFIFSAFREEHNMSREFPQQYLEYKRRTKMLVPYIF